MSAWARQHGVALVGGSITERRDGRDKLSNTCCVFAADGSLAAVYRKIHLFDVEVGGLVYRESEAEEAGDEPVVTEVEGWGRRALGLLRPPLPRALPDPGAGGRGAADACRRTSRS